MDWERITRRPKISQREERKECRERIERVRAEQMGLSGKHRANLDFYPEANRETLGSF